MISHRHRTIFIHIPKTAGQSIELFFLELHGYKWEDRVPLLLNKNNIPELGPEDLSHLTAEEYIHCGHLTKAQFSDYFKFAFVRNPWSRMVSLYKFLGYDRHCEFGTFLRNHFMQEIWPERYYFVRPQAEYIYGENKKCLVDFVGRFEDLQKDFDKVCEYLKMPPTVLPRRNLARKRSPNYFKKEEIQRYLSNPMMTLKRAYWKARKLVVPIASYPRYQDYYDKDCIDMVAQWYQVDIETFGYTFNDK